MIAALAAVAVVALLLLAWVVAADLAESRDDARHAAATAQTAILPTVTRSDHRARHAAPRGRP